MATTTFNPLRAAKALTAAGFEASQAEAITNTIREAFTESVATKADIAAVKAELKAELKADMAQLKGDVQIRISDQFASLYKQMTLGLVVLGIVIVILAA